LASIHREHIETRFTVLVGLIWVLLTGLTSGTASGQQTATYELTFVSEWSATTHPANFPSNAHYSGLIGTTHKAYSFWLPNALASAGIQSMAETGSKSNLNAIFNDTEAQGIADFRIDGPGLATSPASVTISFQAQSSHPFLTLVSMIAPSPDWFVGVSGLPLMAFGAWQQQIEIDLYAWDAGTDSGTSYASSNVATQPPVPISRLTGGPFLVNGTVPRMGRFILNLLSVTGSEKEVLPVDIVTVDSFPNPFSDRITLQYSLPAPGHVSVQVFNLEGSLVETLVSESKEQGTHQLNWRPGLQANGPMLLRIASGQQVVHRLLHQVR